LRGWNLHWMDAFEFCHSPVARAVGSSASINLSVL
jgi:hypothetical protein